MLQAKGGKRKEETGSKCSLAIPAQKIRAPQSLSLTQWQVLSAGVGSEVLWE